MDEHVADVSGPEERTPTDAGVESVEGAEQPPEAPTLAPEWAGTWCTEQEGFTIDNLRHGAMACAGNTVSAQLRVKDGSLEVSPRLVEGAELGEALREGASHVVAWPFEQFWTFVALLVAALIVPFVGAFIHDAISPLLSYIIGFGCWILLLLIAIFLVAEFLWGIVSVTMGLVARLRGQPYGFRPAGQSGQVQFERASAPQVLRLDFSLAFIARVKRLINQIDYDRRGDWLSWLFAVGKRMLGIALVIVMLPFRLFLGWGKRESSIFVFITGGTARLSGAWRDFGWLDTVGQIKTADKHSFHYVLVARDNADAVQGMIEESLGVSTSVFSEELGLETFLAG
ncbi:MAG: hypothetical protein HN380_16355 [Victivallales bacterium]|jgi:hypothetical protein|nr:hypothetical protein [Victivallales bacterium]